MLRSVPSNVSVLSGAVSVGGMRLVFPSLLLELPSPLLPALLDSHERFLEVVLWTKATLSDLVVRYYAADAAEEPFPPRAQLFASLFSWLKIFRVGNFRGLSQPRKYFNENFSHYGM